MFLFKAQVATNCEDDPFRRVKVRAQDIWPVESELLPSVNAIYLDINDTVIVQASSREDLSDALIIGKLLDYQQKVPVGCSALPNSILFTLSKGSNWIVCSETCCAGNEGIVIETSRGFKVEGMFDGITITTPLKTVVEVKDGSIVLNANAGTISIKNSAHDLLTILSNLLTGLIATVPAVDTNTFAFSPAVGIVVGNAITELEGLLSSGA